MNETVFIKTEKKTGYSVIDNRIIYDDRLSAKARMICVFTLSLPTDWVLNFDELCTHFKEGSASIRSGLNELKKFGYLSVEAIKDENNKFVGSRYIINEAGDGKQEEPKIGTTKKCNSQKVEVPENGKSKNRTLLNTNNNQILNKLNTNSNKILNEPNTDSLSDSLSQSESSGETGESSEANASSLSKKRETKPRKRASAKTPKATVRKTLTDEQLEDFFALIPDETHAITREIVESLIMINQRKDPHYFRSENFIKNKTKDIIEFLNNSGRTAQEAKDVFNFAIQDSFWVNVIISADVFIRNYEKLFQKMATKKNGGSTSSFSKPKQKVAYSSYEVQDYNERSF